MSENKRHLKNDENHANATHKRWMEKFQRNRDTSDKDYPDEWYSEQCMFCRFYMILEGDMGYDWGVCTNEKSAFDGRPMFEHDGCEHHEYAEDYGSDFNL